MMARCHTGGDRPNVSPRLLWRPTPISIAKARRSNYSNPLIQPANKQVETRFSHSADVHAFTVVASLRSGSTRCGSGSFSYFGWEWQRDAAFAKW